MSFIPYNFRAAEWSDVSMYNFTRKELVGSLCCPALTILWCIIRVLTDLSWGAEFTGKGFFRLTPFIAFFVGGFLPIILTLACKIHTEHYLKKRLILIVIVYVFNGFIGLIGVPVVMFALYMTVGIGAVIYQLLKVQDEDTSGGERAVIMLSDPIVYWTIYHFIFWIIKL